MRVSSKVLLAVVGAALLCPAHAGLTVRDRLERRAAVAMNALQPSSPNADSSIVQRIQHLHKKQKNETAGDLTDQQIAEAAAAGSTGTVLHTEEEVLSESPEQMKEAQDKLVGEYEQAQGGNALIPSTDVAEEVMAEKLENDMPASTAEVNKRTGEIDRHETVFNMDGDEEVVTQSGLQFKSRMRGGFYMDLLWPSGSIPYKVDPSLNKLQTGDVLNAIDYIDYQLEGCISFKPATEADDVVLNIVPSVSGCYATVGYDSSGGRTIHIALGCSFGNIVHELSHVLGMYHEQQRSDRDSEVEINAAAIKPGYESEFDKSDQTPFGTYDLESIMHYGRSAFAISGDSIVTKNPAMEAVIGQRLGYSEGDVKKIREAYKCSAGAKKLDWVAPHQDNFGISVFYDGSVCTLRGDGMETASKQYKLHLNMCPNGDLNGAGALAGVGSNFNAMTPGACPEKGCVDVYIKCSSSADCPNAVACNENKCDIPVLTDIDECASNPCQNGGACTDGLLEFACACPAGFTGPTCSVDESLPQNSEAATIDICTTDVFDCGPCDHIENADKSGYEEVAKNSCQYDVAEEKCTNSQGLQCFVQNKK